MTMRLFLCPSTFTEDLAVQAGPSGIRANCIAPENTTELWNAGRRQGWHAYTSPSA
jgi:NAD(P)-dependent dehydrogenase (short-subunit alcohol dehydrogenase family)